MPRRALTSRFPALAPLVVEGRIALKALQTRRPEYRLVRAPAALFPFRIHKHHSVLRRRLGDADPRLQELKVQNLRRAAEELDGLSIAPGQVFSYWKQVGRPSAARGFGTGMLISDGRPIEGQGGGLCQMANLLYWMALHSPLTVTEHHHHSLDLFPDSGRVLPFGSGASVFYNYVDLQLRNDTHDTFRLSVWLDDTSLHGELRVSREPLYTYRVVEEDHRFYRKGGQVYRTNRLYQLQTDRRTGNRLNKRLITFNDSRVLYEVDEARLEG
ncbi:VanW family protein [Deinococcus proteolyticus MRP]|uniref:VanW family protein n=1 Tax=Deinococcus proteolyticus (strain ATCC 35074 / DSM 20540 / JCM 6276 / NBRC 101906 / NCIMB 13154 / VKM Ac-1939 / CCM 2703 / MRP) TaxID=693977 RepID=F0RJG2_DEIPM|nr:MULTISPECIES: VanW family protein [Deinococcus]ADY25503.1 VanW family protein [Deinococcus proteolyticus MRP]MCY1701623.1 VanW family protein [Deinococcus sp. SL84]